MPSSLAVLAKPLVVCISSYASKRKCLVLIEPLSGLAGRAAFFCLDFFVLLYQDKSTEEKKRKLRYYYWFSRYLFPRRPIILNIIIIFIRACRLRRRFSAPSLRPQAVLPQSCKKSFLRSLFCSSGTSAYVLAGFPPTTSRGGW